jgi:hypothetical protein
MVSKRNFSKVLIQSYENATLVESKIEDLLVAGRRVEIICRANIVTTIDQV